MPSQRKKTATMQDVAEAAGVSMTTVSHVVHHTATISPETAARVHDAMQRLSYVPLTGGEPRRARRVIGLVYPKHPTLFYSHGLQALLELAQADGYSVMICDPQNRADFVGYYKRLHTHGLSGILFLGNSCSDAQILAAAELFPTVLVGRPALPGPIDTVCPDIGAGMTQLIQRLASVGYRRLGYVGPDTAFCCDASRYASFLGGLNAAQLELYPQWVHTSRLLRENQALNAHDLIRASLGSGQTLPQVYLCADDVIAAGGMAALRESGYHLPQDVGVTGFGDISVSAYLCPPLTTVAMDAEEFGRQCFLAIRRRMRRPDAPPQQWLMEGRMLLRESVRL